MFTFPPFLRIQSRGMRQLVMCHQKHEDVACLCRDIVGMREEGIDVPPDWPETPDCRNAAWQRHQGDEDFTVMCLEQHESVVCRKAEHKGMRVL